MERERVVKVVVVGDAATGKTSLIKRFCHDLFSAQHRVTVGCDFALKQLTVHVPAAAAEAAAAQAPGANPQPLPPPPPPPPASPRPGSSPSAAAAASSTFPGATHAAPAAPATAVRVGLQLWDVAGQDRCGGSLQRVYFRDALGAVFVYDATRPETLDALREWKAQVDDRAKFRGRPLPGILLRNKSDLAQMTPNDRADADAFCAKFGLVQWFPTSAKENVNVSESITALVQHICSMPEVWESIDSRDMDQIELTAEAHTSGLHEDALESCPC